MSEAALLRVLADRLDEFDALKQFPADLVDPGNVTVEWTAGSDHPGYEALSQAISAMVEQHWAALRTQVVKKKETEVKDARRDWSEFSAAVIACSDEQDNEPVATGMTVPQQLSRVQQLVGR